MLADLGLDKAAEAGLIKLLAAMPSVSRRGAEDVRQRIHMDVSGWGQSEEAVPHLLALQDAVWQERRLRLRYERGDGATVERVVDPLASSPKDASGIWLRLSRASRAAIASRVCVR